MNPLIAQLEKPSKPLPNKDVCNKSKNDTGINSHKIAAPKTILPCVDSISRFGA